MTSSACEAEQWSDLYLTLWRLLANAEAQHKWFDVSAATDEELLARALRCVTALGPGSALDAQREVQAALEARARGGEDLAATRERFGDLGMSYARQVEEVWGSVV